MATKLGAMDFVIAADEFDPQVVSVVRKRHADVEVFVTSIERLDAEDVRDILQAHPNVKLISNIKRDGHIMGDAMTAATRSGVGVFKMGDTIRALRDEALPKDYES